MAKKKKSKAKTVKPRLTAAERQKILDGATEEFRQLYTSLLAAYNDESSNLIRGRYAQGKDVLLLLDENVYGEKSISRMADCLGEDRSYLQNCGRFAQTIKEDEVDNLIEARMADGNAVTWSHITVLFTIEEREDRDRALEHLLLNSLSFRAFRAWRDAQFGKPAAARNSTGRLGKRDRRPQTLGDFIQHVSKELDSLIKHADDVWLKDDEDDERTLRNLFSKATVDKKTMEAAESAQMRCQGVANRMLSLERELGSVLADLRSSTSDEDVRSSTSDEDVRSQLGLDADMDEGDASSAGRGPSRDAVAV